MPARLGGSAQPFAASKGVKAVPPGAAEFVKPQNDAVDAASLFTCMLVPATRLLALAGFVMASVGKAVRIRFEPAGHEVMKGAASEKMALGPRGVSRGEGDAATPEAARIND